MAQINGLHANLIAEQFKSIINKKGYAFFDKSRYNLNIIGIRNSSHNPEKFDDSLLTIYKNNENEWEVLSFEITTEPGPSILRKPINPDGTAILVPDQYRGVYQIGTHGGSYRHIALVQRNGKVKVYRDTNKNSTVEIASESIQDGMFGINIHRHAAPNEKEYVRGSSAGCQVFKNSLDFADFMETCNKAADIFGNSFTYTLIEEEDLS